MKTFNSTQSRLTLVGAGPGDPELLTLKAVKALRSADVVLYDALVNEEILEYAAQAERIFVGKREGFHSFSQEEINKLIVTKALKGKHVVRLKGGDPFVFGRGKEEQEYAESFGIETTVIPGISSCVAVPSALGIPVTSRGVSESFWVITGTTSSGKLSKDIALAAQSSATVIILMGLKKLRQIVEIYLNEGKGRIPVAVIQNGTLAHQKEIISTVSNIVDLVEENHIHGPAVLVIGEVVHLATKTVQEEMVFELEDEFIFQNLDTYPFMN